MGYNNEYQHLGGEKIKKMAQILDFVLEDYQEEKINWEGLMGSPPCPKNIVQQYHFNIWRKERKKSALVFRLTSTNTRKKKGSNKQRFKSTILIRAYN